MEVFWRCCATVKFSWDCLHLGSVGSLMSLSSALLMTSAQNDRKLLKVFTVMDAIDCSSAADKFCLWRVVLRLSA